MPAGRLDLGRERQLRETNEIGTWAMGRLGLQDGRGQAGSASGARLLFKLNFGNH